MRGAGGGAAIGAAATGDTGGALVGGALAATAGALFGNASEPGRALLPWRISSPLMTHSLANRLMRLRGTHLRRVPLSRPSAEHSANARVTSSASAPHRWTMMALPGETLSALTATC